MFKNFFVVKTIIVLQFIYCMCVYIIDFGKIIKYIHKLLQIQMSRLSRTVEVAKIQRFKKEMVIQLYFACNNINKIGYLWKVIILNDEVMID